MCTIIDQAIEYLRANGPCSEVEILSSPSDDEIAVTLRCRFELVNPNNLPSIIDLKATISHSYPYSDIEFYPCDAEPRGFPHQSAKSGKLCLVPRSSAPTDFTRLSFYAYAARNWLIDADSGELSTPYELPDFRTTAKIVPKEKLFFSETEDTYQFWTNRIGLGGKVTFKTHTNDANYLIPIMFNCTGPQPAQLTISDFNLGFFKKGEMRIGRWLLLPEVTVYRHLSPHSFGELRLLCRKHNVEFDHHLELAWKENGQHVGLLMLGFPIPPDKPHEIHWQLMAFDNINECYKEIKSNQKISKHSHKIKPRALWPQVKQKYFGDDKALPWCEATNLATSRITARGSLALSTTKKRIAIIGGGALGSSIIDCLARGGIQNISIIDEDYVEFGNMVRHVLHGHNIGDSKAVSLARELHTSLPFLHSNTLITTVPPESQEELAKLKTILDSRDVIMDFSTDHDAFLWVSRYAKSKCIRVISAFFDLHAETLTLCSSGRHISAEKVYRLLMDDILKERTPIDSTYYMRNPNLDDNDKIIPGVGCWHATYPGKWHHIQLLAATATEIIDSLLSKSFTSKGIAFIVQRQPIKSSPGHIVEIVWQKEYR